MLMIFSAVCALMTPTVRADAAYSTAAANSAGFGRLPPSLATVIVTF
jgi:hypothetical protein